MTGEEVGRPMPLAAAEPGTGSDPSTGLVGEFQGLSTKPLRDFHQFHQSSGKFPPV